MQFHLYFLSSHITHNNILLLLHETHNTLHLCVLLLLLIFLPALSKISTNLEQKKYFIDHRTANAIQLFVPIKISWVSSFSEQIAAKWNSLGAT